MSSYQRKTLRMRIFWSQMRNICQGQNMSIPAWNTCFEVTRKVKKIQDKLINFKIKILKNKY